MPETYPGRAYLILCDARTGSSLLSSTLRGTGRAGKPFEYFGRAEIDKPWLRGELHVPDDVPFTGFRDWRGYILRAGAEFGGVFGAAVHFWQIADCVETFRSLDADPAAPPVATLRAFFPELRLVWLTRANLVAQAISHYVAIATDVWNSHGAREKPPGEIDRGAPYDFERIDALVRHAQTALQGWRETLQGAEAITLPLTYEELAADLPGAVRRVCAHAGVDLGDAPFNPGLKKQAGAWSKEMERRYRDERRARGLDPLGDEA